MNTIQQLFPNLATFMEYAPGVDASKALADYLPSARSAQKNIEAVISPNVFAAIVKSSQTELLDVLRAALANRTLAAQLVFDAIARRKAGTDVYKYEIEGMQRAYMENYFAAMDNLIQLLMAGQQAEGSPAQLWRTARYGRLLEECPIRQAEEFDAIYPIDLSYLFFFRTVPLQRECLDERLAPYFERAEGREKLRPMLLLALAKLTVAKALRRFDMLEFPPTIRNLFADNKAARQAQAENDNAVKLAASLEYEADKLLADADLLLDERTADACSLSHYNAPDDLIVMAP
jgi:hypothetical protein